MNSADIQMNSATANGIFLIRLFSGKKPQQNFLWKTTLPMILQRNLL